MSANTDPATGVITVTPSDTADVAMPNNTTYAGFRGLMVNVAGNVNVVMSDNSTATMTVAAGVLYPIRVKRVLATGTTATGIFIFL